MAVTHRSTEFAEIMRELEEAAEEAADMGYPSPSDLAVSNAKLLLRKMYQIVPRRFEVYPTPDAEIAIDAPGDGGSLVMLCDSNGGVLCMANFRNEHHTRSYTTTDALPDGFVTEALAALGIR